MNLPTIYYTKSEYVDTATGNKVFKNSAGQPSTLCGTQNVVLNGKSIVHKNVIIRGDMSPVRVGKHCIIGEGSILRPSQRFFSNGPNIFPIHIGDNVMIEEGCIISAAQIGSFVHIGKGSIIGRSAILKECCRVLPGSVITADSVFPPFSTIAGYPAKVIGKEPECTWKLMAQATKEYYDKFIPRSSQRSALS